MLWVETFGFFMAEQKCARCEEAKKNGTPVQFKQKNASCFICKKNVEQVLDLHHTNADLCSIECETKYWFQICYD